MQSSLFVPFDRLIAPPPEARRVAFLSAQPYAHRGLHGTDCPENSRAAFAAAIAAGHGIECDVQAAREGEAFVFHDTALDRLTDAHGAFAAHSAHELDQIRLRGSDETIPRLAEILAIVAGRVPILIEIKSTSHLVGVLCLGVRRALEGYLGNVAVMSFNPAVGRWFRNHAPRFVRGLVKGRTPGSRGSDESLSVGWRCGRSNLIFLPMIFAICRRPSLLASTVAGLSC